jgi:hypothetical protein
MADKDNDFPTADLLCQSSSLSKLVSKSRLAWAVATAPSWLWGFRGPGPRHFSHFPVPKAVLCKKSTARTLDDLNVWAHLLI